jgi:hypothetical protein
MKAERISQPVFGSLLFRSRVTSRYPDDRRRWLRVLAEFPFD